LSQETLVKLSMEYTALAKNIKVSPRKVRIVADGIRNLSIASAQTSLMVSRKRGAVSLKKALDSAIANAVNNKSAKKDELKIKEINITEGIKYKRYHFAGRGRTRPYQKRTSHINVVLEDAARVEVPQVVMPAPSIESKVAKKTKEVSK
jgi:large subunit ribosomal protein L22